MKPGSMEITGHFIDIPGRQIRPVTIYISGGQVASVIDNPDAAPVYILPGFIDAHIHIESSMLTPYEFARKALIHGTVATISDPHEIANVCGMEGVNYMLENAREALLKFHFGAPSCVPATSFETAGASLNPDAVKLLLQRDDIFYLSEMMNYPGVLSGDRDVMEKIKIAKSVGKPVDGHSPGLTGADAIQYINAGITTDHECFTLEEAIHKVEHGMKILIREGSAARNFEALHPLISSHPKMVMFCSDDKHPDELEEGHINQLVKRALHKGHNLFDVLQCACINPVHHYKMKSGLLREGDPADLIVIDNPENFYVLKTYINGIPAASNGKCVLENKTHAVINNFSCNGKSPADFVISANGKKNRVIEAIDGQLITRSLIADMKIENGNYIADPSSDILKLAVVNRYRDEKPSVALIKGFGLKSGAFASTVAHDSHNIIAVGTDDEHICDAVNLLIMEKGGLSVSSDDEHLVLPLPVAGLMSTLPCEKVASLYSMIDRKVKNLGCSLRAPYMTLSFMALLVIPELKLSDKGLFDGRKFEFVNQ